MKIATWNVNSLRKRSDAVAAWIERAEPDVLCLQETKVSDPDFPAGMFRECRMQVVYHGQKSYNGVAIAAAAGLEDVERGLPGMQEQGQARLIAATVDGVRIVCAYVPNGGDREKYAYKLDWLGHFAAFLRRQRQRFGRVVAAGDYNVAPTDEDVYDIERWGRNSVAVRPPERQAWQRLIAAGYEDAADLAGGREFTWWDYRSGAFAGNRGLRIDHFLLSGVACAGVQVERDVRGWPQPSDHAPVLCRLRPAAG